MSYVVWDSVTDKFLARCITYSGPHSREKEQQKFMWVDYDGNISGETDGWRWNLAGDPFFGTINYMVLDCARLIFPEIHENLLEHNWSVNDEMDIIMEGLKGVKIVELRDGIPRWSNSEPVDRRGFEETLSFFDDDDLVADEY